MSADNMILVIRRGDEYRVTGAGCSMSYFCEDEAGCIAHEWGRATPAKDRGGALTLAHDRANDASVLEYGVIECELPAQNTQEGSR